ncbi:MAG: uroporphyrinogen-III synthase [Pseudomonadales bacterium]|nr:uroporphyrinogen-III synthase [Pseudomonadales bacterium]
MSDEEGRGVILLTRPAGQNESLARRLSTRGYRTIERPLLEILPLEPDDGARKLIIDLDQFDDIIFVSGNAVEFGLPLLERYWPQWPVALHWAAVGPATAGRLPAGLSVTFPPTGASEAMLQMERFAEVSGRKVMIVRGKGGRELLADTLRQ